MMTIDEVLEITINMLNGVNVPVCLMDQIGTPISQAIGNLTECVKALKENGEKETKQDEPETQEEEAPTEATIRVVNAN